MQVFGLARIGRDAELRHTANNDSVCNLSLAFSYGKKDGNGKRPTQWVEGVLWGKRAEALAPYLVKGQAVAVTLDEVRMETYESQNGGGTKIIGNVTQVELAGSPTDQQPQQQAQRPPQRAQQTAQQPRQQQKAAPNFSDMDDDIPF